MSVRRVARMLIRERGGDHAQGGHDHRQHAAHAEPHDADAAANARVMAKQEVDGDAHVVLLAKDLRRDVWW